MSDPSPPDRTRGQDETRDPRSDPASAAHPPWIGRYRIDGLLGKGGYGIVYRGHDVQLDRPVAVKVPHSRLVSQPEEADAYMAEARTVASLDHPHIVPVFDVGQTDACPCYIVSKYIDGMNLAKKLKRQRMPCLEAVALMVTVAEALHYAHKQGLVHRDVKPGNILIDHQGQPYVVDFGIALREEDFGRNPTYAGTPAYMSPEQARGEGHRVDGRSDVFSLGVVLYELLAGRKPFRGDSQMELMRRVIDYDPRPLRQVDEHLPKELDRICQKAMAKKASERYSSAHDLAEDLRHFLIEQPTFQQAKSSVNSDPLRPSVWSQASPASAGVPPGTGPTSANLGLITDTQPCRIVPKGLRSFDAHDADFFVELLPGPRDRDGLPESLRFWKKYIEESDPDRAFPIGLIYGPSGCGKSSLVKAGLLPRLAANVRCVYVESSQEETETRLLRELRKHCPEADADLGLKDTVAALRRGQAIPAGTQVLIILDQFEQWLHAKREQQNTELVQALRQCDGVRVQCIVMMRDDFWLAATRFMGELEVDLLQGQNTGLVDLFDLDHARRVLAAFGRAYGRLPERPGEITKDQRDFLQQAVQGLAEEGKVICVRLALFAEMMKGKSWSTTTLKEVGGAQGVGVTFLDENFSTQSANPKNRLHQQAARAVLQALLPDLGTDIKGQMKSSEVLRQASGYARRPKDFDDLIKILDGEVRLITPADVEADQGSSESVTEAESSQKYYQLTHDFLVHPLREWLTRKQQETQRGRAELLLAERAGLWNAKPESRHLPAWWEYLTIRLLTRPRSWSEAETAMMRHATRFHGFHAAVLLLLIAGVSFGGLQLKNRVQAHGLIDSLVTARADNVQEIAADLAPYRFWSERRLRDMLAAPAETLDDQRSQLHARLALLHYEPAVQLPQLVEAMLEEPDYAYVRTIGKCLENYRSQITEGLWQEFSNRTGDADRRFRAGLALAAYEPESEFWTATRRQFLVQRLVAANPVDQPILWDLLSGVREDLVEPLECVFRNRTIPETHQIAAANALRVFAADDPQQLARLLTQSSLEQYEILFPILDRFQTGEYLPTLRSVVQELPAAELESGPRVALGQQRAAAASALFNKQAEQPVLDMLHVDEDPEALTQFVHGCRERGVDPSQLLTRLETVYLERSKLGPAERKREDSVVYGLLLAIGEFLPQELPAGQLQAWSETLGRWYAEDPSSAVHGAVGWLLRTWGRDDLVRRVDSSPLAYDPSGVREWFVQAIEANASGIRKDVPQETLYFTFIVFPPDEYDMGSPENESDHVQKERLHRVRLTKPLAVSDRELMWKQFDAFMPRIHTKREVDHSRTFALDEAVSGVSWFEAVRYCRWLTRQAHPTDAESKQCFVDDASLEKDEKGNPISWPLELHRGGFRLLTEAEWEYVCRSGTRTAFSFGSDLQWLDRYGCFQGNSKGWSHCTGSLRPNLRGMFDLHGNLWEWCYDWHGEYSEDLQDPTGPESGAYRVGRGGSWVREATQTRSANRARNTPDFRNRDLGFRIAFTLPDE